jgi:hypothetical protein
VAYRFSILDGDEIYTEVSWANPQVTRYHSWTIPGRYTQDLTSDHITLHVEVCNLAGYTYSGTPILTEPFARDAVRLKVMHPVAGGNLERQKTPHPAL